MTRLFRVLQKLITANGPLTVAQYMRLALQHPTYGYYRQGERLGAEGDFITAPEMSQMFGEMVGLWFADLWRLLGRPPKIAFLELGPGRGKLLEDVLRATAKVEGFHKALSLYLLESNESFRVRLHRQFSAWHPVFPDSLDDLPSCPLFVLANEFFDALPARQFVRTDEGWCERLVTTGPEDTLVWTQSPPNPAFSALIPAPLREAPPSTIAEVSTERSLILRTLAERVARRSGGGLVMDYGATAPTGRDTLHALSQHQLVDFLERPGDVDVSADVDFSLLTEEITRAGLRVLGPKGQGAFLDDLGIGLRAAHLKRNATPEEATAVDGALRFLTSPDETGVRFKAMGFVPASLTDEIAGFA